MSYIWDRILILPEMVAMLARIDRSSLGGHPWKVKLWGNNSDEDTGSGSWAYAWLESSTRCTGRLSSTQCMIRRIIQEFHPVSQPLSPENSSARCDGDPDRNHSKPLSHFRQIKKEITVFKNKKRTGFSSLSFLSPPICQAVLRDKRKKDDKRWEGLVEMQRCCRKEEEESRFSSYKTQGRSTKDFLRLHWLIQIWWIPIYIYKV